MGVTTGISCGVGAAKENGLKQAANIARIASRSTLRVAHIIVIELKFRLEVDMGKKRSVI
jgi:hypothetical protein